MEKLKRKLKKIGKLIEHSVKDTEIYVYGYGRVWPRKKKKKKKTEIY